MSLAVFSSNKRRGYFAVLAVLLFASIFFRAYQVDLRPFHNDEGVNYFFLEQMKELGYYKYSHKNYHGPAYFYLTSFCARLFGESEFGIRSSAILMGILLILQLLMLKKSEGKAFVIISGLLCALSSSLVFYSRYAIHESLFLFSGSLCALSSYLWWRFRNPVMLYSIGLALALLITTKETFIITLFCVFFAFISLGGYRKVCKDLFQQRIHLFGSLLIMLFLVALIFSGGGQWYGGLREMFLAVPQWIGRNESDTGHFKPFLYYTHILIGPGITDFFKEQFDICLYGGYRASAFAKECSNRGFEVNAGTEIHLIFAFLIPLLSLVCVPRRALRYLISEEGAFFRFTAVWSLLAFLVYSFVSYKTPWLIINLTLPLVYLLAVCLNGLVKAGDMGKIVGSGITVLMVIIAALLMYRFNFELPYGSQDFFRTTAEKGPVNIKNPFSYTHTHPGMLELMDDIDNYMADHPGAKILVGVPQYWPLPYYLRFYKKQLGYLAKAEPKAQMKNYQVMIIDSRKNWSHKGWGKKYYRLSDVQESHTFFKRESPKL